LSRHTQYTLLSKLYVRGDAKWPRPVCPHSVVTDFTLRHLNGLQPAHDLVPDSEVPERWARILAAVAMEYKVPKDGVQWSAKHNTIG
ncbi:hypothetical protein BaRGS_00039803, partial [Batillaria attramentaria]